MWPTPVLRGGGTIALLIPLAAVGCAGADTVAAKPDGWTVTHPERSSGGGGERMTAMGEMGAIDQKGAAATFGGALPQINECIAGGRKRQPYLGGEVDIFVRIDGTGKAELVHLQRSTLGDHEVEACIRNAIAAKQWPRPVGGKVGEARRSLSFAPEGHLEVPQQWSAAELAEAMAADNEGEEGAFRELKAQLDECRKKTGVAQLSVTWYLDEDGMAQSVGLFADDPKGREAAGCLQTVLSTTSFPSPRDFRVKATVTVP